MNELFNSFDFDLFAVTLYLLTLFLSTNVLKKKIEMHPVFLSWLIAAPLIAIVILLKLDEVSFHIVLQYIFLTLMLNGGVKTTHVAYDFLASRFSFLKERERAIEQRRCKGFVR
jgi:hypothetical protein